MANQVINVTAGSQAILCLGNTSTLAEPDNANAMKIPFMQDITISAAPGTVRYSVLDSSASKAFTTVNENSVSGNMLVDEDAFFGNASITLNSVGISGLFATSIAKTEVYFSIAFEGTDSGDHYIEGSGFIGGLAPTASMDAAVWLTPIELICNGELTAATI
jgi:hypothetical protein